jgi:hypothetical protein
MLDQLPLRSGSERADSWLKLLEDNKCLDGDQLVSPSGRRLEIAFEGDKVGPIHHDHGLTKAAIDGAFIRREHLDNITYFRLDSILSITVGRER